VRFVRRSVTPFATERLRTLAARDGWLVETPDALRCGFGGRVGSLALEGGLRRPDGLIAALGAHELSGDGPPGSGVVAFAALAFERDEPAHFDLAAHVVTQSADGTWLTSLEGSAPPDQLLAETAIPTQEPQSLRSLAYQPTPEEYALQVARAVERLRRKELDKVVLARAVRGSVPEPIDAAAIAARLRVREPRCTIYSLPTADGRRFVGASPELLARRTGARVECNPLAGTITLPANVAPDDYETWLLGSAKNLHEHEVLVDDLVARLAEHYDDIRVDPSPSIMALRTIAHLSTWLVAERHEDGAPDALEVLSLLHPTAAVGGTPREAASELIGRLEGQRRGNFAGPVGWVDAQGDGEWWIGIRGVLVAGREFEAWAGAGIVSESDPAAEREETRDKLAAVLTSVLVDRV
jgi:menaquinone-specific isochorismate synthase